jgi:uncharacterized protein with PQ loop repeat
MRWLKQHKFQIQIIGSIAVIFVLGMLAFYLQFHKQKISDKQSDWASFASYVGLIVSICNLVILGIISVSFSLQNIKLQKPCIIFEISLEEKEKAYYVIKNVGRGAALNILVKYKNDKKNEAWDLSVICYSLGPNDKFKLFWKMGGDEWIAIYDDILGNHYASNIKNDTMTFDELDNESNKKHRAQDSKALWNVQKEEIKN